MQITIMTEVLNMDGWIVELRFNDDKMATFSVDRGSLNNEEMFDTTMEAIKRQLEYLKRDLAGEKKNA